MNATVYYTFHYTNNDNNFIKVDILEVILFRNCRFQYANHCISVVFLTEEKKTSQYASDNLVRILFQQRKFIEHVNLVKKYEQMGIDPSKKDKNEVKALKKFLERAFESALIDLDFTLHEYSITMKKTAAEASEANK